MFGQRPGSREGMNHRTMRWSTSLAINQDGPRTTFGYFMGPGLDFILRPKRGHQGETWSVFCFKKTTSAALWMRTLGRQEIGWEALAKPMQDGRWQLILNRVGFQQCHLPPPWTHPRCSALSFIRKAESPALNINADFISDQHHLSSKDGTGLVNVHRCSLHCCMVFSPLPFIRRVEMSAPSALHFFMVFSFLIQNWMSSPPFHFPSLDQKFPLIFQSNFEHAPIASINSPIRDILYFAEVGPKVMIYEFGIVNKIWKSFIRYTVDLGKRVGTCMLCNSNSLIARMLGTLSNDFISPECGFHASGCLAVFRK